MSDSCSLLVLIAPDLQFLNALVCILAMFPSEACLSWAHTLACFFYRSCTTPISYFLFHASLMRAPLLLTSMVSLSPSVIIQVSISSITCRCCPHPRNNCAEKLYGWKDYEAIGRSGVDLLVDDFTGTSINKMMECLKSGQSWSDQFPSMKRSSDDELVGVTSVSWSDIYGHSNLEPIVRG